MAHGRQNEPSVAVDPRNTNVLVGSSNDYCGVYNANDADGDPVAGGPIWLGYYRSENGGAQLEELARSRLPGRHLAVRGAAQRPDRVVGRPGDRLGRPRPRVLRARRARTTRPARAKTFGDVWVARFDNPGGPDAADTTSDGCVRRHDRRRQGLVGAEPARQVQRQDGDRGRPHRRPLRRQRLLLLVALHGQRRRSASTSRARPTTAPPSASRSKSDAVDPRRPVPGHLGDRQRPRLRDVPSVRRPGRRAPTRS